MILELGLVMLFIQLLIKIISFRLVLEQTTSGSTDLGNDPG